MICRQPSAPTFLLSRTAFEMQKRAHVDIRNASASVHDVPAMKADFQFAPSNDTFITTQSLHSVTHWNQSKYSIAEISMELFYGAENERSTNKYELPSVEFFGEYFQAESCEWVNAAGSRVAWRVGFNPVIQLFILSFVQLRQKLSHMSRTHNVYRTPCSCISSSLGLSHPIENDTKCVHELDYTDVTAYRVSWGLEGIWKMEKMPTLF